MPDTIVHYSDAGNPCAPEVQVPPATWAIPPNACMDRPMKQQDIVIVGELT